MKSVVFHSVVAGIFFFILVSSAAAQIGIPHQFKGAVYTNSASAPDGIPIIAKISGSEVASTVTVNGNYGRLPGKIFYIEDVEGLRYGKTIEFFVGDVKAAEYVFSNGESTVLDLSVSGDFGACGDNFCGSGESCSSCSSDCGQCQAGPNNNGGGSSGGFSTGGGTPLTAGGCNESWSCSEWSICSEDGRQFRSCTDQNACKTNANEPTEEEACTYVPSEKPKICNAGTIVCVADKLRECVDGNYWNVVSECPNGCDSNAAACNTTASSSGAVSIGAAAWTGMFFGENSWMLGAIIAVVIIAAVLALYLLKFRKR